MELLDIRAERRNIGVLVNSWEPKLHMMQDNSPEAVEACHEAALAMDPHEEVLITARALNNVIGMRHLETFRRTGDRRRRLFEFVDAVQQAAPAYADEANEYTGRKSITNGEVRDFSGELVENQREASRQAYHQVVFKYVARKYIAAYEQHVTDEDLKIFTGAAAANYRDGGGHGFRGDAESRELDERLHVLEVCFGRKRVVEEIAKTFGIESLKSFTLNSMQKLAGLVNSHESEFSQYNYWP